MHRFRKRFNFTRKPNGCPCIKTRGHFFLIFLYFTRQKKFFSQIFQKKNKLNFNDSITLVILFKSIFFLSIFPLTQLSMASKSKYFGKKNLLQGNDADSKATGAVTSTSLFKGGRKPTPVLIRTLQVTIKEIDHQFAKVGMLLDEKFDPADLLVELLEAYGDVKDAETGERAVEKLSSAWESKALFYAKINERNMSPSQIAEIQNLNLTEETVYKVAIRFSAYSFMPPATDKFPIPKLMVGVSLALTSFSPIEPNLG